jgi:hypothetical protein
LLDLVKDPDATTEIGRRTRAVAEEKFESGAITDRFEQVLTSLHPKG